MPKKSVLTGRGRITGALQWRVNAKGSFKVTPKAPPTWHRVKGINWVAGKSLERIKLLKVTPDVARGALPPIGAKAWALVKVPSSSQIVSGCDRCGGKHRKHNGACAAALGIPSPMTDPDAMYDFATGEKLSTCWVMDSEHRMPRARVFTRVYRRVS